MRFLNADPIGFTGGMNWYVFVHNNPLTNVDPSGLLDGGAGNTLKGLQVPYVPINPQPSNPWLTESMSVKIAGPSIMVLGTGYKTEYLGGRNTGRLSGFDSPLGYQSGEVHESNYISAFQILGFTIRENHFVEEVIWTRDYARRYTTDRITWFPKSFESDLYGGFELKKGGSGVGAGSLRVSINKDGIGGTFTFFSLGVGFGPVNAFGVSIEENFKIRFNSQDVKINILRGSSNPLNLQQPNNTNKNCKE
jgi:hypothetical protein